MAYVTRQQIRDWTECPTCRAQPGEQCWLRGKGAQKKMRQGVSHFDRMKLAQLRAAQMQDEMEEEEALFLIDTEDDFEGVWND